MSKQAMREESERLVKEALEGKALTVSQGKTRIDSGDTATANRRLHSPRCSTGGPAT
jgi:hypothetical protein